MLHIQSAEEAQTVFYEAFMHCDQQVMNALWAKENVVCVHPSGAPIMDYAAITSSWENIFQGSDFVDIRYRELSRIETGELAVHIVHEQLMDGDAVAAVIIATNVFRLFDDGWLMIEHHGSVVNVDHSSVTLQ